MTCPYAAASLDLSAPGASDIQELGYLQSDHGSQELFESALLTMLSVELTSATGSPSSCSVQLFYDPLRTRPLGSPFAVPVSASADPSKLGGHLAISLWYRGAVWASVELDTGTATAELRAWWMPGTAAGSH